jgi:hypothetical protein
MHSREIVRRHVDLVHSAALRQVHSPELAEEVAQAVFIELARRSGHPSVSKLPESDGLEVKTKESFPGAQDRGGLRG